MRKITLFIFLNLLLTPLHYALAQRYATQLCEDARFKCLTVKQGQTWHSLFPDEKVRDMVMRINRMNTSVSRGVVIAIPKNFTDTNVEAYSPFEPKITATTYKQIIVDPTKNAFGAYDEAGNLVHWGPVSAGREWCPDEGKKCHTVKGEFTIYEKRGAQCFSSKFPLPDGGAPMPYCMFFHGGFALHASAEVPGYNASHGCVRIFLEDAKWLNEKFIETGETGTHVIIEPY